MYIELIIIFALLINIFLSLAIFIQGTERYKKQISKKKINGKNIFKTFINKYKKDRTEAYLVDTIWSKHTCGENTVYRMENENCLIIIEEEQPLDGKSIIKTEENRIVIEKD